MARETVVDEVARAALQRLLVETVDRRGREPDVGAAGGKGLARDGGERDQDEAGEGLHGAGHHHLTRAGTGFVLSRTVYHGISRKKRK